MRIIVHNPFRRAWSIRLGRVRLFSVPWYWDVLRERLAGSLAKARPVAPRLVRHEHYCEACDRRWTHEGHTCAHHWAWPCAGESHNGEGTGRRRLRRWLLVVRRDRAELCKHLCESFESDKLVTVVPDRRQSERRARRAQQLAVAVERRRWRDRRTTHTDEDSALWADLGFRAHRDRTLPPR